jgi:hypothetical protein
MKSFPFGLWAALVIASAGGLGVYSYLSNPSTPDPEAETQEKDRTAQTKSTTVVTSIVTGERNDPAASTREAPVIKKPPRKRVEKVLRVERPNRPSVSESTQVGKSFEFSWNEKAGYQAFCLPYERAGRGGKEAIPTEAEWKSFMKIYHESKRAMLGWLNQQTQISAETRLMIRRKIEEVRAERPPTATDPLLSYRGVLSPIRILHGDPLRPVDFLQVGDGFLELVRLDPVRAKFEVTRSLAQLVSPCAMTQAGWLTEADQLWSRALQCGRVGFLGCEDPLANQNTTWVASTLLARTLVDPGCHVKALESVRACLSSNRSVASVHEEVN